MEWGLQRPGAASVSHDVGPVDRPRKQVGLRCRQPSLGPPFAVWTQHRRAFEECGRGGVSTAATGRVRRRLDLGRDPFVRPCRGRGQVPGARDRVDPRVARRREGPVGLTPLPGGRGVVDRRPDERVGEAHLWPEGRQTGRLSRLRRELR